MKVLKTSLLALLLAFLLAAACIVDNLGEKRETAVDATPCIATTGERDYQLAIVQRPPDTARPGDAILIRFTGGYYDRLPACEIRGGTYYYHYPSLKELSENLRTVTVYLDEEVVASVECPYECQVEFSLPNDARAGAHRIVIRPSSWLYAPREAEFEIEVTGE